MSNFRLQLLEKANQNSSSELTEGSKVKVKERVKEGRNGKKSLCPICTLLDTHKCPESHYCSAASKKDNAMANYYLRAPQLTCKNYIAAICSLLKITELFSVSVVCCHRTECPPVSCFKKKTQEVT